MSSKLTALFESYADSHRHPINRLTHKIAIPLIVFHIMAMLDWVPLAGPLTLGHAAYGVAMAWYFSLDVPLALVMAAFYGLGLVLGRLAPPWLVVVAAIVGWTVQLAGHLVWEKKQPAFFTNLIQALVGPLFFAAVLLGRWPASTEGTR